MGFFIYFIGVVISLFLCYLLYKRNTKFEVGSNIVVIYLFSMFSWISVTILCIATLIHFVVKVYKKYV